MKKIQKNSANNGTSVIKKRSPLLFVLKIILIILTVIYPVFMVIFTGSGLIYNSESYGAELTQTGVFFIISGILMTVGTVLCCLKKNIVSIICSCTGFALCMAMLYKLVDHADRSGWSNKLTMEPISDMYFARIIPVIAPFIIAVTVAIIQFFSYEAAEKRRVKRKLKEEEENRPAPPII